MRNSSRALLGAGVFLAILGVPSAASARDVKVTYIVRQAGLLAVPDRGEAAPEYLVGNSPLFDRRNRRQVGAAPIVCTFPAEDAPPRCVSTLYLRRGSLNLAGDLSQPKFRFRVTGGRGIYADAKGTARGVALNLNEPDPFRARVRLTVTLRGVE